MSNHVTYKYFVGGTEIDRSGAVQSLRKDGKKVVVVGWNLNNSRYTESFIVNVDERKHDINNAYTILQTAESVLRNILTLDMVVEVERGSETKTFENHVEALDDAMRADRIRLLAVRGGGSVLVSKTITPPASNNGVVLRRGLHELVVSAMRDVNIAAFHQIFACMRGCN